MPITRLESGASSQVTDEKQNRRQKPASNSTMQKSIKKNKKRKYKDNAEISQNIWIIKPGENTNRGVGISVSSQLKEIRQIIQEAD